VNGKPTSELLGRQRRHEQVTAGLLVEHRKAVEQETLNVLRTHKAKLEQTTDLLNATIRDLDEADARIKRLEQTAHVHGLTFGARLRWLFTGRF
jgi:hypothetical protein